MLNRRDTQNPEGGGSEVYLESIARGLVLRGHDVTIFCGSHDRAGAEEDLAGVRMVRAGSKLGVHKEAIRLLRRGDLGSPDVIVDVQNGIPFFAKLAAPRVPIVVLVHHTHREQWPVVYGPVRARIGWLLESQVAPRVYRRNTYVAVSEDTRAELGRLGVDPRRIEVIHNGTDHLLDDAIDPEALPDSDPDVAPRILVLGRLVPHKQVEHVFAAAAELRVSHTDLTVSVVGDGWWEPQLRIAAKRYGVDDIVEFPGFVSEADKHHELSRAWVLALPSLKEGWGIVVMEAARHGVPSIGYRSAGGVAESIADRETGLLVDSSVVSFTNGLRQLLNDPGLRLKLGDAARQRSQGFSWDDSVSRFEQLLARVCGKGNPVDPSVR